MRRVIPASKRVEKIGQCRSLLPRRISSPQVN
jgi:hypothetical protein